MEIAKIKAEANRLQVQKCEILTAGLVGATVVFAFSPEWEGLTKTAVFRSRKTQKERALISEGVPVVVPWEVLDTAGLDAQAGVYGTNAAGDLVIPTVWGDLGRVQRSAQPAGKQPPTPEWPDQIEEAIKKNADDLAGHIKDQDNPHQVTAVQIGAIPTDEKGKPDGVATLGPDGKVPAEQLPKPAMPDDPPIQTAYAVCYDGAEQASVGDNTWYIPKTMPRPSGEVGMMLDVFWKHGSEQGMGYGTRLLWGDPEEPDAEEIVGVANTMSSLTGSYSIRTEGTVRYQLEEADGRKRWRYVSGDLVKAQFSSDTPADVADKKVPRLGLEYLPGMEIYLQLDRGNVAPVMQLVPDAGPTLPVYGNGRGEATGAIPGGYILHLVNAGDHWQIINSPGTGSGTTFTPGDGLLLRDGVLSVDTADVVEQDNTRPVTSAAVFTEVGNIDALLSQI